MKSKKYPEGKIKKWSNDKLQIALSINDGGAFIKGAGYTTGEVKEEIIKRWRTDHPLKKD